MQNLSANDGGIKNVVKSKILDEMIRTVQTMRKWKILIVDYFGLLVLNSCMKMNELINENITLIEPLEKLRQPYTDMEAIYFMRPTFDGIRRIIEDFAPPSGANNRKYAACHLFFISELSDTKQHFLSVSAANTFIKTISNIHLDYLPLESSVFITNAPYSFIAYYGKNVITPSEYDKEQERMANQISSFCKSIGEFPYIRFLRYGQFQKLIGKTAALVYRNLHDHAKTDHDFPINDPDLLGENRSQLIILDRSVDKLSTFLHEFTYQAMATDLVSAVSEDGKTYSYQIEDGSLAELALDESNDKIWEKIRHSHIAECVDEILETFQKILEDHPSHETDEKLDVASLKAMLTKVPEFQEMKSKVTGHINLIQECLDLFKTRRLADIASIEQDLATGETIDGKKPINMEGKIMDILRDPNVNVLDKLRLLLIYVTAHGVVDDKGKEIFAAARLSPDLKDIVRNLTLMGIDLRSNPSATSSTTKDNNKRKNKKKKKNKGKKKGGDSSVDEEDENYELSRYKPSVYKILKRVSEKDLDEKYFPFIKDPREKGTYGSNNLVNSDSLSISSMSTLVSKPSWHLQRRRESNETNVSVREKKKGKIIIFVIGGITYAEMRSVYEVMAKSDKEAIIGSTHIITPENLINDLRVLREPLEIPCPPEIPFEIVPQEEESEEGKDKKKKSKKKKRIKRIFKGMALRNF